MLIRLEYAYYNNSSKIAITLQATSPSIIKPNTATNIGVDSGCLSSVWPCRLPNVAYLPFASSNCLLMLNLKYNNEKNIIISNFQKYHITEWPVYYKFHMVMFTLYFFRGFLVSFFLFRVSPLFFSIWYVICLLSSSPISNGDGFGTAGVLQR